jgi:hypothetical protein
MKINLKGVSIGDGFCDPYNIALDHVLEHEASVVYHETIIS